MKNLSMFGAAAAYVLLLADPSSMVAAKDHLIVKEDVEAKQHDRPMVSALKNERCLADSDDSKICVKYGGNLTLGWEWGQLYDDRRELTVGTTDSDTSKYELSLEAYSSQKIGLGFLINLMKLFYIDIKGETDDFKIAFTLSMTYYLTSRRTCFNLFYYLDDFYFNTKMNMRFGECYKNVINLFYDYDNWASKYAKWADECRLSSPTTVEVYKYEYFVNDSSRYIT